MSFEFPNLINSVSNKVLHQICTKITRAFNAVLLDKLKFVNLSLHDNDYGFYLIYNGYDRANAQLYASGLCHRACA